MSFTTHTMFAEYMYECQIDANHQGVLSDCHSIRHADNGRSRSNSGGYQSHDLFVNQLDTIGCNHMLRLVHDIRSKLKELPFPHLDCELDNIWINMNYTGHFNKVHTHLGARLAGVYYVTDTNVQTGQAVFMRDTPAFIANTLRQTPNYNHPATDIEYTKAFPAGTLILFSPHLFHYVNPNETTEPRVTLGFNVT